MFVTFEGCEGVGKSTQLRLLKEYLDKTGQKALFIREPGSTDISEQIRAVILDPNNTAMHGITEVLLYAASRAQLVREKIMPALERGELVICDRYIDSSVAYQGYARGLGVKLVKDINSFAIQNCMPDCTVFIDLPPSAAWRNGTLNDRIEHEPAEFHNAVYRGYLDEIKCSTGRFICIKPEIDKYATSKKIIDALKARGAIK